MILEVYDLECLSNLFTYTGYDIANKKWYQYAIHKDRDDSKELHKHLWNNRKELIQIGFNNLAYDYTLLHHFLKHCYEFSSGQDLACDLYKKSQEIIETQFSEISDRNKFIKQIDLYKIWHYNNAARACSLKDLEIAMRMDNVEEMPLHHTHWCSKNDIQCVLDYNKNDVLATAKFFLVTLGKTDYSLYKGKNKLQLRLDLNKKFKVNLLNKGDVPMGEELMLNLYSRAIGANPYEIKQLRTPRENIHLKDCIPSWCKLENKEFINFLEKIKNLTIKGEKGEFQFSVIFHNYKLDFGLGGSHGCCNPKIWESTNDWMILDLDVSSLYPSIARSLKLYPNHLGPEFMQLYEKFIDDRINEKHKPKAERDNVLIEGYKLVLNGTYGKSNEDKSFMYDPLYTFKTTIAGQLFICMWSERMVKAVPELKFIQTNTDGITIYIPRNKLETIREVCNQLTKETTLVIEEAYYSKMIVRDVNNYISVYDDSTPEHEHIKLKGAYEIDKEYHKDPSMRIVPLAVKNYFVYGIPVAETIKNHKDIFDFCLRLKTNSKSIPKFQYINDGKIQTKDLARTTRYFISNAGGRLYKQFTERNTESGVNVGYSVTLFNEYKEKDMKDYNINYNFYIAEANKLVYAIDTGQLNLFEDDLL